MKRMFGRAAGLALVLVLAGCAVPDASRPRAGRVQLALPAGEWVSLGEGDVAIQPLGIPDQQDVALQTRAVGLRGADQALLAVVIVQGNLTGDPRDQTLWTQACPTQRGVHVEDAVSGSPARVDCLRFKRWAEGFQWLEQNHPHLWAWVKEHKAAPAQSYSHIHYRYSTDSGAYVAVNALVDQRLLEPRTRSNQEFLQAGQPGLVWARQLARAARVSTAMLDGTLTVPPFPYAVPSTPKAP